MGEHFQINSAKVDFWCILMTFQITLIAVALQYFNTKWIQSCNNVNMIVYSSKFLQFAHYGCVSTNKDMYLNYIYVLVIQCYEIGLQMRNLIGIVQNEVNMIVVMAVHKQIYCDGDKYDECYCYLCWNDILHSLNNLFFRVSYTF